MERQVLDAYTGALALAFPEGLAILAVGGFGRGELFPYSDIDLLLLVNRLDLQPAGRDAISVFLRVLWDGGLRVSHSVRTVEDCVSLNGGNIELTISLLDERFLIGDWYLHAALSARLPRFVRTRTAAISQHLAALTRARHAKYRDTIYHLEPNVKESPGGLRDCHAIRWLVRLSLIEPPEELEAAHEFLASLRMGLHDRHGRDQNVLDFDAQEAPGGDPSALMRAYYRHARAVFQTLTTTLESIEERNSSLLAQFRSWRSRFSNCDFTVMRERVLLRRPQAARDARFVMRLFQFLARHQLRLAPDTVRRLAELGPDAPNQVRWDDWKELLAAAHPGVALRAMQESGVLTVLLPEWRQIEFLVVRDYYHRYTVDEHTIVALESLEQIGDARFRDLMVETENPGLLRFALLLHDIGKGAGDHVRESVRTADRVMARLETPSADRSTICFLIERHLELSSILTSRDLGDAVTARLVADRVQTIEHLKLLTLLTYSDISAVNPTAMTPWRLEQLWRVYLAGYEELTRELAADRIQLEPESSPERAAFLEGFPVRYLRTHSDGDIQRHIEMARKYEAGAVVVDLTRERSAWRLMVLTKDRTFLCASIAGALASFGMNILKAEAFANARGLALDTFTFADPLRTLELNPTEVDRLRDTVRRVVEGRLDPERLLRSRPNPSAGRKSRIRPSVSFNNDASHTATLVEIVAEDRPGLLYDLARAISSLGANIDVVLVDTEAHKALDVFYITAGGGKLPEGLRTQLSARLLEACSVR